MKRYKHYAIYIRMKFGMLQVRENEVSLRKQFCWYWVFAPLS